MAQVGNVFDMLEGGGEWNEVGGGKKKKKKKGGGGGGGGGAAAAKEASAMIPDKLQKNNSSWADQVDDDLGDWNDVGFSEVGRKAKAKGKGGGGGSEGTGSTSAGSTKGSSSGSSKAKALENTAASASTDTKTAGDLCREWSNRLRGGGKAEFATTLLSSTAIDALVRGLLERNKPLPRELEGLFASSLGEGKAAAALFEACMWFSKNLGKEVDALKASAIRSLVLSIASMRERRRALSDENGGSESKWMDRVTIIDAELGKMEGSTDVMAVVKRARLCEERFELLIPGSKARTALAGKAKGPIVDSRGDAMSALSNLTTAVENKIESIEAASDSSRQAAHKTKLQASKDKIIAEEEEVAARIQALEMEISSLRAKASDLATRKASTEVEISQVGKQPAGKKQAGLPVPAMKEELKVIQKVSNTLSNMNSGKISTKGVKTPAATIAEEYVNGVGSMLELKLEQQGDIASRVSFLRTKIGQGSRQNNNSHLTKDLQKKQAELLAMQEKQLSDYLSRADVLSKESGAIVDSLAMNKGSITTMSPSIVSSTSRVQMMGAKIKSNHAAIANGGSLEEIIKTAEEAKQVKQANKKEGGKKSNNDANTNDNEDKKPHNNKDNVAEAPASESKKGTSNGGQNFSLFSPPPAKGNAWVKK